MRAPSKAAGSLFTASLTLMKAKLLFFFNQSHFYCTESTETFIKKKKVISSQNFLNKLFWSFCEFDIFAVPPQMYQLCSEEIINHNHIHDMMNIIKEEKQIWMLTVIMSTSIFALKKKPQDFVSSEKPFISKGGELEKVFCLESIETYSKIFKITPFTFKIDVTDFEEYKLNWCRMLFRFAVIFTKLHKSKVTWFTKLIHSSAILAENGSSSLPIRFK